MAENFANDYGTTLDGAINDTDAALTLASATGAPSAPFRVRIENELILVGARTTTACSSLTRGAEGTTAASHATGSAITHVLTAAGLESIRPAGKLYLSAAGGWPSTTAGCAVNTKTEMATNKENYYTLDFDTTTQEYAEWTVAMPSDWNASTVTAVFYWMHPATTTNFGVTWALAGYSFGNDDTGDAAFGTLQDVDDTGGTTSDIYISGATAAITIGGSPAASELVQFRATRVVGDAADNMAVDAKLLGVMVTYGRA